MGLNLHGLNVIKECKRYNLSLWKCPQFLFLMMGIIIIFSMLFANAIAYRYIENPQIIALIVLSITGFLFTIGFIIIKNFEKLAEIDIIKTEFISVASHQLRAPLSNLRWSLDLLASGKIGALSQKQIEYFKILKENTDRMRELVQDLLIVSRIETAKLLLKKTKFSLTDLVKGMVKEYQGLALALNVEIIFKAQENLPMVLADPSQIKLVVENLLENAIRYIKGKGLVEINLSQKRNFLYFEIKDNGLGIPKEKQKYIFQKFFRTEEATKHQPQGSGLGLYIAKSIIKRSAGKIGFLSEKNKGTTFWFMIPLK